METQPESVWQAYRRKIIERRIERAHYRTRNEKRDLLVEASNAPNTMFVGDASTVERAAEADAIRAQVTHLKYERHQPTS